MERDFMGLIVKQETPDEVIDAAPVRVSAMQWSFSNKSSPQLLSFQGDNSKPTDLFDSDHKPFAITEKQSGGVRYTTHRPVADQMNLTVSPAAVHRNQISAAVTSCGAVVGTTDMRNSCKMLGGPAQLTIFYNGSVCVYDNISPEKAQAIMLLAGNVPTMSAPSLAPFQTSMPRPSILDGVVITQPYPVTPRDTISTGKPMGSVPVNFLSSGTVPQFRRKSLARFLEKRKERVISASPYGEKQSPECNHPNLSSGSCPVPAAN